MRSTIPRDLNSRLFGLPIFGHPECGPKFHYRSFVLIEECCPTVESVLSFCRYAGSCGNDTTFNRIQKFRFDRSGRKMGAGRHQTLDRHDDGGIRQADQCPAMHQSASLREIDAKIRDARSLAPFDGVITDKLVEVGDTVQPGQPLMNFSYSKFLRIQVEVPARLVPGLHKDMVVPARLDVNNTKVNARVALIAPKADSQQHTITVKFDLPEGVPGGPGMYAEVMIPDINSPTRALPVVPKSAIIKRGSLPSVRVLDEEGKPRMRLIRTGIELDALMRASDLARELTGTAPGGRASAWIRQELERRARAD